MRNSRSLRLALAGATLLISGAALANSPGAMPSGHGGMMGSDIGMGMGYGHGRDCGEEGWRGNDEHYEHLLSMHGLDALNLNKDQRKKVTDLRRELRKNTWDLRRQEIDQREELETLYSNDTLDVAAIKSAYEKLFQVKLKMIEHTLNFKQSLSKILTKEQMDQFHQMMYGPKGGRHHHGEMMAPPMGTQ